MAISKTSRTLILSLTLALAIAHPLQAQDSPQDYVDAHNKARADVGVGPVSWNYSVAAVAKDDATQYYNGGCSQFIYHGDYGVNIEWSTGELSGVDAVKSWVDTEADYDYSSNTCIDQEKMNCITYTQVVWRNSVGIGCAKVKCDSGSTVVVCYYQPAGNIFGQKPY